MKKIRGHHNHASTNTRRMGFTLMEIVVVMAVLGGTPKDLGLKKNKDEHFHATGLAPFNGEVVTAIVQRFIYGQMKIACIQFQWRAHALYRWGWHPFYVHEFSVHIDQVRNTVVTRWHPAPPQTDRRSIPEAAGSVCHSVDCQGGLRQGTRYRAST